jgi:hypothetical protein
MDNRPVHALKTQPLSTFRYPLVPPFSGSSPVVPAKMLAAKELQTADDGALALTPNGQRA